MVISEVCGELPKRYLRKKIVGGGYLRIMGETTPLMGSLKPPFMIKKRLRDSFVDSLAKITGTATKLSGEITKIPSLKELGTSIEVIGELQKDTTLASHAYPWHSKMFTTIDRDKKNIIRWNRMEN